MYNIIVPVFGESRIEHFRVLVDSFYKIRSGVCVLTVVEMGSRLYDLKIPHVNYVHVESNEKYLRSKLLNAGAKSTEDNVLIFHDVDVPFPDNFLSSVISKLSNKGCISNFFRFFRLGRVDSETIFKAKDNKYGYQTRYHDGKWEGHGEGWTKLSCTMLRSVWNQVGRWNEGFVGWGLEDDEMSRRLEFLGYKKETLDLELLHLWHPLTSPGWKKSDKSLALYNKVKSDPMAAIKDLRSKIPVDSY